MCGRERYLWNKQLEAGAWAPSADRCPRLLARYGRGVCGDIVVRYLTAVRTCSSWAAGNIALSSAPAAAPAPDVRPAQTDTQQRRRVYSRHTPRRKGGGFAALLGEGPALTAHPAGPPVKAPARP